MDILDETKPKAQLISQEMHNNPRSHYAHIPAFTICSNIIIVHKHNDTL